MHLARYAPFVRNSFSKKFFQFVATTFDEAEIKPNIYITVKRRTNGFRLGASRYLKLTSMRKTYAYLSTVIGRCKGRGDWVKKQGATVAKWKAEISQFSIRLNTHGGINT